jgi:hypothetical protein
MDGKTLAKAAALRRNRRRFKEKVGTFMTCGFSKNRGEI